MAQKSIKNQLSTLNKLNFWAAGLHAVQAMLVLVLARDFSLPINVSFLRFNAPTSTLSPASETIYNLPLAWLLVAFFVVCAVAHISIATVCRKRYEQNLKKGLNSFRWYEYSVSASIMMVAIAMLVGIYDAASLLMLFSLVAIMNLCGLVMEVHNQTTAKTNWLSFVVGCLAGIVPWLAVALYFWAAATYGGGQIPTFVYYIYVTIFVFFNCFALNMFLQYKQWGPWQNYLFGEKIYIILSFVAKSSLAWQVFAGTLRPM